MATEFTVQVPTEDGQLCAIPFTDDGSWWTVKLSHELIDAAPEAVAAALTMALLQIKAGV